MNIKLAEWQESIVLKADANAFRRTDRAVGTSRLARLEDLNRRAEVELARIERGMREGGMLSITPEEFASLTKKPRNTEKALRLLRQRNGDILEEGK